MPYQILSTSVEISGSGSRSSGVTRENIYVGFNLKGTILTLILIKSDTINTHCARRKMKLMAMGRNFNVDFGTLIDLIEYYDHGVRVKTNRPDAERSWSRLFFPPIFYCVMLANRVCLKN